MKLQTRGCRDRDKQEKKITLAVKTTGRRGLPVWQESPPGTRLPIRARDTDEALSRSSQTRLIDSNFRPISVAHYMPPLGQDSFSADSGGGSHHHSIAPVVFRSASGSLVQSHSHDSPFFWQMAYLLKGRGQGGPYQRRSFICVFWTGGKGGLHLCAGEGEKVRSGGRQREDFPPRGFQREFGAVCGALEPMTVL